MKKLSLIFMFIFLTGALSVVYGQQEKLASDDQEAVSPARPNLLRELGLTRLQIQQMRKINADWQPRLKKAQQAFREAQDDLDEAIYLEVLDDSMIEEKMKTVHKLIVN